MPFWAPRDTLTPGLGRAIGEEPHAPLVTDPAASPSCLCSAQDSRSEPDPASGRGRSSHTRSTTRASRCSRCRRYPASLVTSGGRGVFATLTLNGLVSQEYGLTTNDTSLFTDDLRRTWAHDEAYGKTDGQLNADPDRLLHAVGVAVGDLDGNGTATDPKVEAAYLVRGSAGSDDHLYVMGSQGQGFPLLADKAITGGALSLAMTEKTATVPALLYVRYPTSLKAYRFNSGVAGKLSEVTLALGNVIASGSEYFDIYHRPSWLDPGEDQSFSAESRAGALAVTSTRAPGASSSSRRSCSSPSGDADAVTLSSITGFTPVVHSLGWSDWRRGSPARSATTGHRPPVRAVSPESASMATRWLMTGRTAGDNRIGVDRVVGARHGLRRRRQRRPGRPLRRRRGIRHRHRRVRRQHGRRVCLDRPRAGGNDRLVQSVFRGSSWSQQGGCPGGRRRRVAPDARRPGRALLPVAAQDGPGQDAAATASTSSPMPRRPATSPW